MADQPGLPAGVQDLIAKAMSGAQEAMQTLGKAQEALDADRERLEAEKRALAQEKEAMMRLPEAENDIVDLNCGGQRLTVKRSTLCMAEGSLLASMFSGRWEDRLEKDASGAFYLEVDAWCMQELLTFLRLKRMAGPEHTVPLPTIPAERRKAWDIFAEYYGVHDYLLSPYWGFKPAFDRLGEGVTWDGRTLKKDGTTGYAHAVCSVPLSRPTAWKVRILNNVPWVLVGVVGEVDRLGPDVHTQPTTYGWSQANYSNNAGASMNCNWPGWQIGVEVVFQLDPEESKLVMYCQGNGFTYSIALPADRDEWHMCVVLNNANSKVEVLPVEAEKLFKLVQGAALW